MSSTFGSRVRQLRQSQTMSQRDLAARACITVSYLDKIERGICPPPSCPTITALACAIGLDIAFSNASRNRRPALATGELPQG